MKSTIAALSFIFLASCAPRQEGGATVAQTATIRIPTAQCSMCEHNIEKALTALPGVDSVTVNAETKMAVVSYQGGSVTLEQLENAITAAGYDANDKQRNMEAYEKLDACCKIPESDGTSS